MTRRLGWPLAAASVVGSLQFVLGRQMLTPIVMGDEYGYLGAALYLGGEAPPTGVPYHPGTGLLYLPAVWLTDGPLAAYHGALATNAVVGALLTIAAWWVCGQLFPGVGDGGGRALVAAATGLYTSFVGYTSVAESEVPFAALELALVGVFANALRQGRILWWALAGLGSAATYTLHPRGAGVIAAGVIVVVIVAARTRDLRAPIGFGLPLALGLVATRLLIRDVSGTLYSPDHYDSGSLAGRITEVGGLLTTAVGQYFYLNAATLGLVTVGLVALVRNLRAGEASGQRYLTAFPILAFAGVYAFSILANGKAERTDHLLYGRYIEGAIAPLLVAGLAVLVTSDPLIVHRRYVVVGAGATLTAAVCFYGLAGPEQLRGLYNGAMVLGIEPFKRRIGWPDPLLIGAAAAVLIAVVGATRRLGRFVPIAVVALIFAAFGIKNSRGLLVPISAALAPERAIPEALARIGVPPCIGLDRTAFSLFHYGVYRLLAPTRYESFGPGETPCGDLIVSGAELDAAFPGARLVMPEYRGLQGLWVQPGALADRLAQEGHLFPATSPGALAAVATGRIDAPVVRPTADGTVIEVTLRVTAGAGAPLPGALTPAWAGDPVLVEATLPGLPEEVTSSLPRTLLPGERSGVITLRVPLHDRSGRLRRAAAPGVRIRLLIGDTVAAETTVS